ncbi:hypothetical protein G9A89_019377 [Geosiphon pyriformis]|nr:hypothetical protein G9A89_019377 [Geosiphon pyriformis]
MTQSDNPILMTDFELTNEYTVHDELDQRKIKKHKQLCKYRLNSKFFTRTSKANPKDGKTSFFVAGVFVDDTIWVENCLAATQYILNIVSEFFLINNIAINTNKTVVIPINQGAREILLSISGSKISIAKKRIFLSMNDMSKPSLAKAHLDIKFFSNVVLKKTITKKQFLYLVSAVLQSIIGYRLQFSCVFKGVCEKWDKMLRKKLKLKANLPKNFLNKALYHPELYSLRTFEQVLTKNLLAGLVMFANAGRIFIPIKLLIDPTNCFLAGTIYALKLCNLSLSGNLLNVFQAKNSIVILDVLSSESYLDVAKSLKKYSIVFLDPRGPVPIWFVSLVKFINGNRLLNSVLLFPCSVLADFPCDFGYINEHLLNSGLGSVTIYTNSFIKNLGSLGACGGVTAYFLDVNTSVGVKVDELLSSTLVKLQTIVFVLECVPVSQSVNLFTDSQVSLNLYNSSNSMSDPNFYNKCWIKKERICHNKVKGHSGVVGNERANFYADAAVTFSVISTGLCDHFDKAKTFRVWHPDGKIKSGYTSTASVTFWSYFMKVLHHQLPVAKRKKMYNPNYSSIACIQCDLVEDSDHVFSCTCDVNVQKTLLSDAILKWNVLLGVSADGNAVADSLYETASSVNLFIVLAKDFVLKS